MTLSCDIYVSVYLCSLCVSMQDAGYGEKSLFAPDQDEDDASKIDDEVTPMSRPNLNINSTYPNICLILTLC